MAALGRSLLLGFPWSIACMSCAVLSAPIAAQGQTVENRVWWPEAEGGNGNFYEIWRISDLPDGLTWDAAREFARSQTFYGATGHLATITSDDEELINKRLGGPGGGIWIGGYQTSDDGRFDENWLWVTGEPFDYQRWFAGQPWDFGPNDRLRQFFVGSTSYWQVSPPDFSAIDLILVEYEKPPNLHPVEVTLDFGPNSTMTGEAYLSEAPLGLNLQYPIQGSCTVRLLVTDNHELYWGSVVDSSLTAITPGSKFVSLGSLGSARLSIRNTHGTIHGPEVDAEVHRTYPEGEFKDSTGLHWSEGTLSYATSGPAANFLPSASTYMGIWGTGNISSPDGAPFIKWMPTDDPNTFNLRIEFDAQRRSALDVNVPYITLKLDYRIEARGQITFVPEPSSVALALFGVSLLVVFCKCRGPKSLIFQ